MFYPSYKRFDRSHCFVDHESPRLEGCFRREPSFYISRTRVRICISSAWKRYQICLEKIKFQMGFWHAFSNYVVFIPVCIRSPLLGPAYFNWLSYGNEKRGKLRWIIMKTWQFDWWRWLCWSKWKFLAKQMSKFCAWDQWVEYCTNFHLNFFYFPIPNPKMLTVKIMQPSSLSCASACSHCQFCSYKLHCACVYIK